MQQYSMNGVKSHCDRPARRAQVVIRSFLFGVYIDKFNAHDMNRPKLCSSLCRSIAAGRNRRLGLLAQISGGARLTRQASHC